MRILNTLLFGLGLILATACNQGDTEGVAQQGLTPTPPAKEAPAKKQQANQQKHSDTFNPGGAKLIKWKSIEEAMEANKTDQKKFFVDVYTDWCGWCKVMDKKTFTDPKVAAYINQNFHPVKLNAEQKDPLTIQGKEYNFVKSGRRGIHEYAYNILGGRAGYPTMVYLDENMEPILRSPGYKKPDQLLAELEYTGSGQYKDMNLKEYQARQAK